jgi:hypothetical protein
MTLFSALDSVTFFKGGKNAKWEKKSKTYSKENLQS